MNATNYTQTVEPVAPPEGFRNPSLKIGDRVKVALTALCPQFMKCTEGRTGTVSCVVFCRSDGKTILYGVAFDPAHCDDKATGGRYESFELDKLS